MVRRVARWPGGAAPPSPDAPQGPVPSAGPPSPGWPQPAGRPLQGEQAWPGSASGTGVLVTDPSSTDGELWVRPGAPRPGPGVTPPGCER